MTNCFKVLWISELATIEEINTAYKRLAHKYHPDKYISDNDMEMVNIMTKKFQQINNAHKQAVALVNNKYKYSSSDDSYNSNNTLNIHKQIIISSSQIWKKVTYDNIEFKVPNECEVGSYIRLRWHWKELAWLKWDMYLKVIKIISDNNEFNWSNKDFTKSTLICHHCWKNSSTKTHEVSFINYPWYTIIWAWTYKQIKINVPICQDCSNSIINTRLIAITSMAIICLWIIYTNTADSIDDDIVSFFALLLLFIFLYFTFSKFIEPFICSFLCNIKSKYNLDGFWQREELKQKWYVVWHDPRTQSFPYFLLIIIWIIIISSLFN